MDVGQDHGGVYEKWPWYSAAIHKSYLSSQSQLTKTTTVVDSAFDLGVVMETIAI